MQHRELLVYDIKHLLADEYKPLSMQEMPKAQQTVEGEINLRVESLNWVQKLMNTYLCGTTKRRCHKVYVKQFCSRKAYGNKRGVP